MDVSVLVPVLDEAEHLPDVLESLQAQDFGGSVEFLLIDGGSRDGSRELIAAASDRDPRIRLLDNPARTTPRALNLGLSAATGEFIVRMDAHARYPPSYVSNAVKRLRAGGVVSVSGPQLAVGYDAFSRLVALALGSPLGAGGARFRSAGAAEIEVDSGFTGIWRRTTLLEHGGWEDDWVGDEDYELATRLRQAGGRIVCLPELAAWYAPRNSSRKLAQQYWNYGIARARTTRRHPESLRPSQVLPAALTLNAAVAVAGPRLWRRLARAGMAAYGGALVAGAAYARAEGATLREQARLPVVWATMHLAYGGGLLRGVLRYGASPQVAPHLVGTLRARVERRAQVLDWAPVVTRIPQAEPSRVGDAG